MTNTATFLHQTISLKARRQIIKTAISQWQFEDIQIADDAPVTITDDGAWVAAAVWIPKEDYEDHTTKEGN